MNLATTPTSFIQNVTTRDVHTGFLARHNIVNPTYQKQRKPITEDTDDDLMVEVAFQLLVKLIDKLLPDKPLRVRIGKEELKILDDWCKEREEYFAKERNETMGSFFARFQINVLKTAALIDLGNIPASLYLYNIDVDNSYSKNEIIIRPTEIISKKGFLLTQKGNYLNNIVSHLNDSNISDYIISSLSISKNSLIYAMKLYDSVFIPYAYQICIDSKVELFTNYLSNIYKIIQEKKKIERSNLMRLSNVSKRADFDEAIETLKEAGALLEYRVRGKTKPITVYVYMPSPYTKLKFNEANHDINVDNGFFQITKKGYVGTEQREQQNEPKEETKQEGKSYPQKTVTETCDICKEPFNNSPAHKNLSNLQNPLILPIPDNSNNRESLETLNKFSKLNESNTPLERGCKVGCSRDTEISGVYPGNPDIEKCGICSNPLNGSDYERGAAGLGMVHTACAKTWQMEKKIEQTCAEWEQVKGQAGNSNNLTEAVFWVCDRLKIDPSVAHPVLERLFKITPSSNGSGDYPPIEHTKSQPVMMIEVCGEVSEVVIE